MISVPPGFLQCHQTCFSIQLWHHSCEQRGFEQLVSLYADDYLIYISKINKSISTLLENIMLVGLFVPKTELYLKGKNIQATVNKSDAMELHFSLTLSPRRIIWMSLTFSISLG